MRQSAGGMHVMPTLAKGGSSRDPLRTLALRVRRGAIRQAAQLVIAFVGRRDMRGFLSARDALVANPLVRPQSSRRRKHSPAVISSAGVPRTAAVVTRLLAVGCRRQSWLEAVISRYTRRVKLEPEELDRLEGAIWGRPAMLDCWSFATGRTPLGRAAERVEQAQLDARHIAAHARRLFAGQARRHATARDVPPGG